MKRGLKGPVVMTDNSMDTTVTKYNQKQWQKNKTGQSGLCSLSTFQVCSSTVQSLWVSSVYNGSDYYKSERRDKHDNTNKKN